MNASPKEKFEAVNKLLDNQEYVLVHINLKAQGYELPEHLLGSPTVTLKLSRWFRGSLAVNEDKIVTDLLFNGSYFTCVIPYESIWGMTNPAGETMIWADAIPAEVYGSLLSLDKADKALPQSAARKSASKPGRAASHLKRVK